MTKAEFQAKSLAGGLMVVGEYRASHADTVEYRDKVTKLPAKMQSLRHTVEVGDVSVSVSERVSDDFQPAKYTSPFKKKDMVVLHLKGLFQEKGLLKANGTLELLT